MTMEKMPRGSAEIIPDPNKLKDRLKSVSSPAPYSEDWLARLGRMDKAGREIIKPLASQEVSKNKPETSPEAEALAEGRLKVSRQLEMQVKAWFDILVSSGLEAAEVKKEISDFLGKIEESALASNVIDLNMARAPQDFKLYRLYQLLKALVTDSNPDDIKPKSYVKFDLEGEHSMFAFMSDLAEKARKRKEEKALFESQQKSVIQEKVPTLRFKNEDVFLCSGGEGGRAHAISSELAKESNRTCPMHKVRLSDSDLGRQKGGIRRAAFIKKNDDGALIWVIEAPAPFETDVLTKDGFKRSLITSTPLSTPSGK